MTDEDIEAETAMAEKAVATIVARIAETAAEQQLSDRAAVAALTAATARLASHFLGNEVAANAFRDTAAQIEAHGALTDILKRSAPEGRA